MVSPKHAVFHFALEPRLSICQKKLVMFQLVSTKANGREPKRYEWLVPKIGLGCLVVLHVLHAVFHFALKP
jgi:hypothetical protein